MTTALPIGEHEMPYWCWDYLSPEQAERLMPQTAWANLIAVAALPTVVKAVAWRLFLFCHAQAAGIAWPSHRRLMSDTGIRSKTTVTKALATLAEHGWLVTEYRPRPGMPNLPNLYALSWPATAPACMSEPVAPTRGHLVGGKGSPSAREGSSDGAPTPHDVYPNEEGKEREKERSQSVSPYRAHDGDGSDLPYSHDGEATALAPIIDVRDRRRAL